MARIPPLRYAVVLLLSAILILACGSKGDADPGDLCFETADLPDGFQVSREVVVYVGTELESDADLARDDLKQLYEDWGRTGVVERSYIRDDIRSFATCKVESFTASDGAHQALEETGFFTRPLLGEPEPGTFNQVDGPGIDSESKYFVGAHATSARATVLFRWESFLGRADIVVFFDSVPDEWRDPGGLVDNVAALGQALRDKIQRESD